MSITLWDSFKLLDEMATGPVIRISLEDGECQGKRLADLLRVLDPEFFQQTVERRRRTDIKDSVHFLEEC